MGFISVSSTFVCECNSERLIKIVALLPDVAENKMSLWSAVL